MEQIPPNAQRGVLAYKDYQHTLLTPARRDPPPTAEWFVREPSTGTVVHWMRPEQVRRAQPRLCEPVFYVRTGDRTADVWRMPAPVPPSERGHFTGTYGTDELELQHIPTDYVPLNRLPPDNMYALTASAINLVSPLGRGQRGLILADPDTGKSFAAVSIAQALRAWIDSLPQPERSNHEVWVLNMYERPEDTELFYRAGADWVWTAPFTSGLPLANRIAMDFSEAVTRAVESGKIIYAIVDSITRLGIVLSSQIKSQHGAGSGGTSVEGLDLLIRWLGVFGVPTQQRMGSATLIGTVLMGTKQVADEAFAMRAKMSDNWHIYLAQALFGIIKPAILVYDKGDPMRGRSAFRSGSRWESRVLAESTGLPETTVSKRMSIFFRWLNGNGQAAPIDSLVRLLEVTRGLMAKQYPTEIGVRSVGDPLLWLITDVLNEKRSQSSIALLEGLRISEEDVTSEAGREECLHGLELVAHQAGSLDSLNTWEILVGQMRRLVEEGRIDKRHAMEELERLRQHTDGVVVPAGRARRTALGQSGGLEDSGHLATSTKVAIGHRLDKLGNQ